MSTDIYKDLIDWIRKNEGYIDSDLVIEKTDTGERLIRTTTDKKALSTIVQIPEKCIIGGENPVEICCMLMNEITKGESSVYYPYIRTLPTKEQLQHLPLYKFDEGDAKAILQISDSIGKKFMSMYMMMYKLQEQFDYLFSPQFATKEWAKYCTALYYSRCWQNIGFVPFVELFNHSYPNDNITYVEQTMEDKDTIAPSKQFNLQCKKLEAGTELKLCYKCTSHTDLYLYYGITNDDTNLIEINVELKHVSIDQVNVLRKNSLFADYNKFVFADKGISVSTLQRARILSNTDKICRDYTNMDCERNAIVFLRKIIKLTENSLKKFDNTVIDAKYQIFVDLMKKTRAMLVQSENELVKLWLEFIDLAS